jgi:hypothetical protein
MESKHKRINMTKTFQEPVLSRPIQRLPFSDAFKAAAAQNEFHTLGELIQAAPGYELLNYEGFDYHLLVEYTTLLERHRLAHYLN